VSHGPGVSQRLILDYLVGHPICEIQEINGYPSRRSQYMSLLRATHRLLAMGKLRLLHVKAPYPTLILCRKDYRPSALELASRHGYSPTNPDGPYHFMHRVFTFETALTQQAIPHKALPSKMREEFEGLKTEHEELLQSLSAAWQRLNAPA
jgi:hypothetical protein